VGPFWTARTWFSLLHSLPWHLPDRKDHLSKLEGSDLTCQPLPPSAVGLATGGPDPLLVTAESVRNTILNARALSTHLQYENRWKLFLTGAQAGMTIQYIAPCRLSFLQSLLDGGRSPSILRVYVAAISAEHARVDNYAVGSHRLVSLFLKRLRPMSTRRSPTWDLPLMLDAL